MLAEKFGVLALPENMIPAQRRRWQLLGIPSDRITSIRPINIPLLELSKRKDELELKFIEAAKKQIDEEGAQAIVSGCLLYLAILGPGSKERLEGVLGVPVINGSAIAVRFAEMMVDQKLSQSRKAYPK